MYICPNCKKVFDSPLKFCYECGTQVVNVEPVAEQQPQYQGNTYNQNPYQQNPYVATPYYQQKKPSKAKEIIGMILSISGFASSIIGIIYTILFMAIEPSAGFFMGFIFSLECFPCSLIGFLFSNGCINEGSTSKLSSVGKALGLAGVIISSVVLFLTFACIGLME